MTIIDRGLIQTHREPLLRGDYGVFYHMMQDSLASGGATPVTPRTALETMGRPRRGRAILALVNRSATLDWLVAGRRAEKTAGIERPYLVASAHISPHTYPLPLRPLRTGRY